jgi:hypothetical protein
LVIKFWLNRFIQYLNTARYINVQNRLNCWEFLKCGREPGGEKADRLGICPAAADASFDGINSGKCGGRIC